MTAFIIAVLVVMCLLLAAVVVWVVNENVKSDRKYDEAIDEIYKV